LVPPPPFSFFSSNDAFSGANHFLGRLSNLFDAALTRVGWRTPPPFFSAGVSASLFLSVPSFFRPPSFPRSVPLESHLTRGPPLERCSDFSFFSIPRARPHTTHLPSPRPVLQCFHGQHPLKRNYRSNRRELIPFFEQDGRHPSLDFPFFFPSKQHSTPAPERLHLCVFGPALLPQTFAFFWLPAAGELTSSVLVFLIFFFAVLFWTPPLHRGLSGPESSHQSNPLYVPVILLFFSFGVFAPSPRSSFHI